MRFKKYIAICLSCMLLLCLAACGNSQKDTGSGGLFSLEQIKELEAAYGTSQDDLLKKLSMTESDIEFRNDEMGLMVLTARRDIHGYSFVPTCAFSISDPLGLYSLRFDTYLEMDQKDAVREAFDALVEEAASMYRDDSQGPVPSGENCYWRWHVGEQSSCTITYTVQNNGAEDDGVYLSVEYRMVIPGSIHDF